MRTLSVVVSSILLAGWAVAAHAQDLDLDTPPSLSSEPGGMQENAENLPPGVIPQPSIESPGMVTGITLGELYTDNLRLRANDKESAWITEVRPFFKAARSSPRFSGVVNAALSGYLYAGKSSNNQVAADLDARGTLTLLPQHFFLDGAATYGRQIVNQRRGSGSGSFFLNNNQANVGTAMLSPWWTQDFGRAGTMLVRYTHGRVVYNDRGISGDSEYVLTGIPNTTIDGGQFSLVSPKYQTWGWNLGYSEQRVEPDYGRSWNFATAKLGTSFQVSDSLRLLASVGKENKFLPDGTVDKLGANFWNAGFEWSNGRDYLKALVGHRFFGHSYELSWTHNAALLTTNISYREQPTSYNQQLLGMNVGGEGLPPINIRPNIPSLTERQPYLSKRLSASATYTMPKSALSLRVYGERRTYFELDDQQEKVVNASLSWLFNLGPYTTLTPRVWWQRYRFRDGQVNYRRAAQLALVHQIDPRNFGSVRLRHTTQSVEDGGPGAHGYTANVIFVQWTHLF